MHHFHCGDVVDGHPCAICELSLEPAALNVFRVWIHHRLQSCAWACIDAGISVAGSEAEQECLVANGCALWDGGTLHVSHDGTVDVPPRSHGVDRPPVAGCNASGSP